MKTTYLVISKFVNNKSGVRASGVALLHLSENISYEKPYKLLLYREKFGKYLPSSFEIINWKIPGSVNVTSVIQDIVNNSDMTYLYTDVDGCLWPKGSDDRHKTIEELYICGKITPVGIYEHNHIIKDSELYIKTGIEDS